jgi:hypothetical protein
MLFVVTGSAWALCPYPEPQACAQFFHSKAVFIGTVISEKRLPQDATHEGGVVYSLRVEKWYKGSGTTATVYTEQNSGGEYLDPGKRYLVYAYQGGSHHPLVIWCRASAEGAALKKQAGEIERLAMSKGNGVIRGIAYQDSTLDKPIPGARVRIANSVNTFLLTTDAKGTFRSVVPPGVYRVRVVANGKELLTHITSYEDQDKVSIQPGQCADLAFLPE